MKKGPRGPEWRTYRVPFDPELAKKKKYRKIKDKRYKVKPVSNSTDDMSALRKAEEEVLWDLFNAACRGDPNIRPKELDIGLACHYIHYGDPYLRLGPFKLEAKNHAPFVGVFRGFMYEKETEGYRKATEAKLVRSRHFGKNGMNGNEATVKRTSSQTWLSEIDGTSEAYAKEALGVTFRLELATRLHAMSFQGGETYQVANYGIGGVYNHHTDSSGELGRDFRRDGGLSDATMMGDRLATAMGYLTDVAAGGATAFPMLGTAVWPRRGDLVFWFNNDRNGQLDKHTFHGGCPVLAGSKWITNKWVRSYAQFQLFPCLLSPRGFLKRLKPLSNDICQMTEQCDKAHLFRPLGGSHLMTAVVPVEDREDFNQL